MPPEASLSSGRHAVSGSVLTGDSAAVPAGDHRATPGERHPGQPSRRARSIVGDILTLQLVFATFLGLLAIAGLWAVSNAVIKDNLQMWAQTWIMDLGEIGAPLYQSEDNERFLRVENYVQNYPDIALVRYYTPDGAILFADTPKGSCRGANCRR